MNILEQKKARRAMVLRNIKHWREQLELAREEAKINPANAGYVAEMEERVKQLEAESAKLEEQIKRLKPQEAKPKS